MRVQCPECSVTYNLDEKKIGPAGRKVRCTKCETVFTVRAETPTPPADPLAKKNATLWSLDDVKTDGAPGQGNLAAGGSWSMDDDESGDMFTPLAKKARSGAATDVDKDMLADLEGAFQQPLVDGDVSAAHFDAPPLDRSAGAGGSASRIIILISLLLVLAGVGGYFYWPEILPLLPQDPPPTTVAPEPATKESAARISLENVRQYFVPNEKEGQLFIIEGKAVNRFSEIRELIRLKASLFDGQGKTVLSQEFMCGNLVSLYQLQVASRSDIEASLSAKVGILTNNTNIQPGASVPFMVVFFKTPEAVEEFGLEVVQSSPQQK